MDCEGRRSARRRYPKGIGRQPVGDRHNIIGPSRPSKARWFVSTFSRGDDMQSNWTTRSAKYRTNWHHDPKGLRFDASRHGVRAAWDTKPYKADALRRKLQGARILQEIR